MKNTDRLDGFTAKRGKSWEYKHLDAIISPKGAEAGITSMLYGWLYYADQHKARYESEIGDDNVLGPAWAGIGGNIRTLLNGETGRLDCGTLDGVVCGALTDQGYNSKDF